MVGVIVKVILMSWALAIAIKYGGPYLPLTANPQIALVAVWLPSIIVGLILAWRWQRAQDPRSMDKD